MMFANPLDISRECVRSGKTTSRTVIKSNSSWDSI